MSSPKSHGAHCICSRSRTDRDQVVGRAHDLGVERLALGRLACQQQLLAGALGGLHHRLAVVGQPGAGLETSFANAGEISPGLRDTSIERLIGVLAVFGGAPLFFYLIHLYGLHLLNLAALMLFGANQGEGFGVPGVGWVWLLAALVAVPCWFACRWFGGVKRRSSQWWMKYL